MGVQPAKVVGNVPSGGSNSKEGQVKPVPSPTVVAKVLVESPLVVEGLYLFAGPSRHSDLPQAFEELLHSPESPPGLRIIWRQVDILRLDAQNDLLDADTRQGLLDDIARGRYMFVIAAPPCSSWSRAPYANREGPVPIRSREFPLGFPWLSKKLRGKAEDSNILVKCSVQAMEAVVLACKNGHLCIGLLYPFGRHIHC